MDELTIRARLNDDVTSNAKRAKRSIDELAKAAAKAEATNARASAAGNVRARNDRQNVATALAGARAQQQAISRLGRVAQFNFGAATKALTPLHQGISSAMGGIRNLTSTSVAAAGAVMRVGTRVGLLAGAASVFGIKQAGTAEQTKIAFETILQSGPKAVKLMSELETFAARTPFRLTEVNDAAKQLLSAGWKDDQITKTLTTMGNAASAVSVPIDRVIAQFAQMKAKGQIGFSDMRVLGEAGIPVFEILAKKMNMTQKELMGVFSTAGGAADLFDAGGLDMLLSGFDERFGGLMEKQSQTFLGRMSNVFDTLSQGAGKIAQPFVDGMLKPLMTRFQPQLETGMKKAVSISQSFGSGFKNGSTGKKFNDKGEVVDRTVGDGIRGGLASVDALLGKGPRLTQMFDKWRPVIQDVFGTLQKLGGLAFNGIRTAFQLIGKGLAFVAKHRDVFKSLAIAIGIVTAAVIYLSTVLAIISATNPVTLAIIGVTLLIAGLIHLYRHSERFRKIVQAIGRFFLGMARDTWNALKTVGQGFVWAWQKAKQLWTASAGVRAALGRIGAGAIRALGQAFGWVASHARSLWASTRGVRSAIARVAPGALRAVGRAFVSAAGFARRLWVSSSGVRSAIGRIGQGTVRGLGRAFMATARFAVRVVSAVARVVGAIARVSQGPIRGLARAFASVAKFVSSVVSKIGALISAIGRIPKTVKINIATIGGGIGKVAGFATGGLIGGDTSTPRIRPSRHQSTHRSPGTLRSLQIGGGSTNRVRITSGHRTHSLGSFNSAHRQGRALDLVGPGLNRVATQVRSIGGYAAFHGNGPTRHLHTEYPNVVAPIGDTTSPRVSPAARPVTGGQSYGGDQFIIHANGLTVDEAKQLVHATVAKRDRDRRERGGR